MRVSTGRLYKRVNLFAISFVLAVSSLSAVAPQFFGQVAHATGAVEISNIADLRNAVEHQADGQTWTINAGNYGLDRFNDITAGGQTGWYLPITANNLTINGVGNPILFGQEYSANGNWSSQDLIAIFGSNVTINGLTLMPKVEPNKTIEVLGDSATIKNVIITPNTLVNPSLYDNISDPTDPAWTQYSKTWGGSIYYNNATGTQTLDNVSIVNGGVSVHAPGTIFNINAVQLSYTSDIDWINDYRFYVATPTSIIHGVPAYIYHVNGTLNNFDSVLAAVGDPTTAIGTDVISLGSDLTTTKQITLTKPVTLDGNGHTINPTFAKTDNSNNSALGIQSSDVTVNNLIENGMSGVNLHGINVYVANNINLNNVTVKNNGRDGLVVNGSNVTVNNLTTLNNVWGGVDVDQGSGVTNPAVLTINGHSVQTESGADILVDNNTNPNVIVNDLGNQYNYTANGIVGVYKLKLTTPTSLTPVNNAYTNNPAFVNTWSNVADATGYEYRTANSMNGNVLGPIIYSDSNLTQPGRYSVNGSAVTRQNGGAPQGTYYWQVRATGLNGRVSDWSQINKVVVDTTAPSTPALLTPFSNGFEITNDFNFTWSGSTDNSSPVTYEFQSDNNGSFTNPWDSITNGNNEQNNLTTPQIHSTGAPDGTYYWRVRAIDAAGNKSAWTEPWKMTIDTKAPIGLANSYPSNGAVMTTAGLTNIQWIGATDATSNPVVYYYESSMSSAINSDGSFKNVAYRSGALTTTKISTLGTPQGTYYWHVRAVDSAGNTTAWTSPWKVVVDNTAPTANFIFPTPGPSATGFQVQYSEAVNAIDATNPANYYLENWPGAGGSGDLMGDANITYDAASHIATVNFTNAGWYISAEQKWGITNIRDLAGNLITPNPTSKYSTDLASPLAPGTPTAATPTNKSAVNWSWVAATDPGGINASGIKGYYYKLTQGANTVLDWSFTTSTIATTSVINDGIYALHVYAVDNAGNVGAEVTGNITYDKTAPVVAITSPKNGDVVHGKVNITGTITDINPDHYYLVVKDSHNTVVAGPGTVYGAAVNDWNWDTTKLADGLYTIDLEARDAANNKDSNSTKVITVTVDNNAPIVTINGYGQDGKSIKPSIDVTDQTSASDLVYSWTTLVPSSDVTISDSSVLAPTFTVNNDGTYEFNLTVTDLAGNITVKKFSFTYTTPVVVIPAPTTQFVNVATTGGVNNAETVPLVDNEQGVLGVQTTKDTNDNKSNTSVKDTASVLGDTASKDKNTFWGLAWYWWLAILALAGIVGGWLITAVRRRSSK
ncbi:MAG: Ig-like domain-containing protein [Candidatus Saccharibacteria bacterium]